MNNKLLLVTAVTLLYRESTVPNIHRSAQAVKETMLRIKLPELSLGIDHEREILAGLKTLALEMCEAPPTQQYERKELLQRIKMVTYEDDVTYLALEDAINEEMDQSRTTLSCIILRRTLDSFLKEAGFQKALEKAAFKYKFERESIGSIAEFATSLLTELEPYTIGADDAKDPAEHDHIDFSKVNDLARVYKEAKEVADGHGMFKTGQKGLNRMLQGGFRPGEKWVFGALQHNYKTGMTLDVFHDCCVYNEPHLIDPTKKPAILFFSFENDMRVNLEFLYRLMYELETGLPAEIKDKSEEELAEFVTKRLTKTGFHVHMFRIDPTGWSYRDICNRVIKFEALGYEVKAVFMDYLGLVPTTGCTMGSTGDDRRDQFRRVRAFMNPRKIFSWTPHQLNTAVKQLVRAGSTELVKMIPGGGYFQGCGSLENEVDGELYGHIEKLNGEKYYTVHRGKHRIPTILPEKDHFAVWKFLPVGNLGRDYYLNHEHTLRKVGGGHIGSGEETPFWENTDKAF